MVLLFNVLFLCCLLTIQVNGQEEVAAVAEQTTNQPNGLQQEQPHQPDKPIVPTPFVAAVNEFGFNLINEINPSSDDPAEWVEPKNVLFSPLGLASAMAMMHQGADGQTAEQFEHILQLKDSGMDKTQIPQTMFDIIQTMSSNTADNSIFKMANALLLQDGIILTEQYVKMIQEKFNADIFFTGSPEACTNINKMFEDKTDKNIPEVLHAIPSEMIMMLLNAVYFKGEWMYPFYESKSNLGEFYGRNETKYENITMMSRFGRYGFVPLDDLQADMIEIPFKHDQMALYGILARDANDDLSDIRSILNVTYIEQTINKLNYNFNSVVTIPRLQMEVVCDHLSDYLKRLGLNSAFSSADAKFTSMLQNDRPLYLDQVLHKVKLNLAESAVEHPSTPVDAQAPLGSTAQPMLFDFNHPFLYFIRHKKTGEILLLGEIHKF